MNKLSLEQELKNNAYPGRGIVIGKTPDGTKAAMAYFIMGRSENSRNRIFVTDGEGIRTQAFDPAKLKDPSLIIYAPVRVLGNKTIVTNGDQTDTIYEGMDRQMTFEQSLRSREFEPDGPNYTPRISGLVHMNASYVSRLLSERTGRTFSQHLLDIRLEQAKRLLLDTSLKSREIAERVGFENAKYFSHVFTKAAGMPPMKYRYGGRGMRRDGDAGARAL